MAASHELAAESLEPSKKPLFSEVRRHYHDELFDVFTCPYLLADPASQTEAADFDRLRQEFRQTHGPFDRSELLDAKFPGASGPRGPLFNLKKSFVYWGCTKSNLPHGWGEACTRDGFCYAGYFDEGEPNYHGQFRYVDGSFYQGGLYRTVKDGLGKLVAPDGLSKEGFWKLNRLAGDCRVFSADGHLVFAGDAGLVPKDRIDLSAQKQPQPQSGSLAELPTALELNFQSQPLAGEWTDELQRKEFGISSHQNEKRHGTPNRKSILKKDHQTGASSRRSPNKIHFAFD